MQIFEHTDKDGDKLVISRHLDADEAERYIVEVRSASGTAMYLPAGAAERLAHAFGIVPPQTAKVATIDWAIGEHTVRIEGGSAMEVATALRIAIGDTGAGGEALDVLDRLAEIFDVEVGELVTVAASTVTMFAEQDRQIRQYVQEAKTGHEMIERVAKDRDARPSVLEYRRVKEQLKSAEDDIEGVKRLRKALFDVGLQAAARSPLDSIAGTVDQLGQENNRLREQLSAAGMLTAKDTIEGQAQEISELTHALQAATGDRLQLSRELARERDTVQSLLGDREIANTELDRIRKVADRYRVGLKIMRDAIGQVPNEASTVAFSRQQADEIVAMLDEALDARDGVIDSKVQQLRCDADALEEWKRMRDVARDALLQVRSEFLNADTEEVEAADLSSEQAALIVAKINRALDASA